jgi:hypothetical protein
VSFLFMALPSAQHEFPEWDGKNECMTRKNPAAVALGRRGGRQYAKTSSPEERTRRARMAAEARWEKQRKRLVRLVGEITKGTKALEKKSRKKK